MKTNKLVKMISAVSILSFAILGGVSCNNGNSDPDGNKTEEVKGKPFTIKFSETNAYTAGVFNVKDDWDSIEVKFAELPDSSKVQFAVVSDAVEKKESWGKSYFSRYPQVAETVVLNLNNWLNEQTDDDHPKTLAEQGATKITSINIQAKEAGVPDVKVASAIVTKKDGTKEAVIAEKDWGSTVTEGI